MSRARAPSGAGTGRASAPPSPPWLAPSPSSAAARAANIVLAMLVEDEAGRPDVATSYARAPTVFAAPGTGGGCASPLMATAAELEALAAAQRPALRSLEAWRNRDRTRTAAVGLILCLNIGTDPPDADEARPSPSAKEECWIDPTALPPQRALEAVGASARRVGAGPAAAVRCRDRY